MPPLSLRCCARLFAGTLALAGGAAARAAPPAPLPGHVPARSYGPAQGLPDVSIRALLQDRTGFVWVAAEEGLYRYDAHRFERFGADSGLAAAPTALQEDDAGGLWVGTRAGLYRRTGEGFARVQGTAGLDVSGLASAGDTVWIASGSGPLRIAGTGAAVALPDWPGQAATAILPGEQAGTAWVARWGERAEMRYWTGTGWQPAQLTAQAAAARIDALARDGQQRIWARQGTALLLAARPAQAPVQFVRAQLPASLAGQLKSARGYLLPGRRGDIWAPVDNGLLHLSGDVWTHRDVSHSLPAAWTRSVLEDREGNLWIGARGLHRLRYDSPFRAYAGREGIDGNAAWSLLRDSRQRLWLAGSGLAELGVDGRRPLAATQGYHLRTITECSDGTLYTAGLPGDAILAHDPASGTVQRIALDALASARVLRLFCDRSGTLWAASEDQGLLRSPAPGREAFVRVELPGGTPGEFVGDIRQDNAGRLWAAGRHGLALFDAGRWQRFGTGDGLRSDHVAYLAPLRSGAMLVGYFGTEGVAQASYSEGRFTLQPVPLPAAAAASGIYLIGEDAQQRLWLGGSRGLYRRDSQGWRHFGSADGLVGEDVNNMAFLAEANGDVWIGTSAGLARLDGAMDAASPRQALPPPAVVITGFRLGAERADPDAAALAVPAGVQRASFRYAALNYADEEQREYRSRLLGQDAQFRQSSANEQHYFGLAPGDYRFEVAARSRDGEWGPLRSVAFTIPPPWWQAGWLRALAALLLAGLVLLGVRWRLARLQARNRALEQHIGARTEELRASNVALRAEIDERLAAERALSALNDEERRRKERFHLITRIAALISANLDADSLLQHSADAIHDVLGYASVDIPLLDPADASALLVRARGGRHRQAGAPAQRLSLDAGIMGAAVRERRAQCINDTDADARCRQAPGSSANRAQLAIPILIGDTPLGVLNVEGDQPFDDLDTAGLAIVADYLAVAIENARLFRQARESAVLAERRRVAHDLHDNIIQILSSISLQAQTLAHISTIPSADPMQRAVRVAELAQLAVREMRALLQELRPAEPHAAANAALPQSTSLPDAVQQLLRLMVPPAIVVEFDFSRYVAQQAGHEQALLRIVQEAVSNAVRHARASILRVLGQVDADTASVSVADNGKGMPARQRRKGLGQESMRARVAALGGGLHSGAGSAGGTVVQAWLPRHDR
ncbi:histidine kinase/DNA gyrase B/HSP90-like ATPase [Tahibacter aquaticus]|uniref:Histidine kinase/DNA gyrase B/HSP90-like ATPase n=1 Tax=Tahibacter aquaticus TaxID=520092 RepID=A0A4R6Z971_9GAMM|nr:GAF domain-containing protein [Tahibacter aquaticus]TDR48423.1 histidine kinase/DNA gyrase B/HSP90-like ATPase [Tahibacter aquaticus]